MHPERIAYLLRNHYQKTYTAAEKEELWELIRSSDQDEQILPLIEELLGHHQIDKVLEQDAADALFDEIRKSSFDLKSSTTTRIVRPMHFAWIRYAAVLLLVVGAATFLYLNNQPQNPIVETQPAEKPDILPGGNKAILTLSDGSTIVLDSAVSGSLAQQGNTKIIKLNNGQLAYKTLSEAGVSEQNRVNISETYNTITTPKGGQYQITLPDGTVVWLNAASSIRFPTTFLKDRTVEITGESYLEVAPDKSKPFFVKTRLTTIQVLGTSFNVNAYEDEAFIATTLLNGNVQVIYGNQITALKPGQQAQVAGTSIKVMKVNTDKAVSWKDGVFNFDGADLPTVMRQLERWYNVKVQYKGSVPTIVFKGKMYRNVSFSDALDMLKRMGVKFEVEGKSLMIL